MIIMFFKVQFKFHLLHDMNLKTYFKLTEKDEKRFKCLQVFTERYSCLLLLLEAV